MANNPITINPKTCCWVFITQEQVNSAATSVVFGEIIGQGLERIRDGTRRGGCLCDRASLIQQYKKPTSFNNNSLLVISISRLTG